MNVTTNDSGCTLRLQYLSVSLSVTLAISMVFIERERIPINQVEGKSKNVNDFVFNMMYIVSKI